MATMNEILTAAVRDCKKLLQIYQEERTLFGVNKPAVPVELSSFILCKKELMSDLEQKRQLLRQLKDDKVFISEEEKHGLRELRVMFERLLIIDHENEKTLRDLLSCSNSQFGFVKGNASSEKTGSETVAAVNNTADAWNSHVSSSCESGGALTPKSMQMTNGSSRALLLNRARSAEGVNINPTRRCYDAARLAGLAVRYI